MMFEAIVQTFLHPVVLNHCGCVCYSVSNTYDKLEFILSFAMKNNIGATLEIAKQEPLINLVVIVWPLMKTPE